MTEFKPKLWEDGSEFPKHKHRMDNSNIQSKYFTESILRTLVSNTGKVYIVYEQNKLGTPKQFKNQKDNITGGFANVKKKLKQRNLLLSFRVRGDELYKGGTIRVYAKVLPLISAESEEE
jgi:hypothetical protein